MKKHYTGLFLAVMLLVVVCCIYGSDVSTVRAKSSDKELTTEQTAVLADKDAVALEDAAVPMADEVAEEAVNSSEDGSSILFIISALLLIIVIVVIVIVATVAASTTVIDKF